VAVVAYDERAVIIERSEINDLCWAFLYGSNLADGLLLGRKLLAGRGLIHSIVYSAPTSCSVGSDVGFWPGDTSLPMEATLEAAQLCATDGIIINFLVVGEFASLLPEAIIKMTRSAVTLHVGGIGTA
jgi:hypothetical protein